MAKRKDWWPTSRQKQLAMVRQWLEVGLNRWDIPDDAVQELVELSDKALFALKDAQEESTNSSVAKAKCREIFRELEWSARAMKKYFAALPLTESDIISLGLKVPDLNPTPSGIPTAQARSDPRLEGWHEMGWQIVFCHGNAGDPANKSFRLHYRVMDKAECVHARYEDLHESFSTKKKKGVLRFKPDDSGKTCYMAVQVENGEMKGPWGPITSALIP